MLQFKRKTRGNEDYLNKQTIFVFSEKYDDLFFEFVNKILRIADCCITYSEDILDLDDSEIDSALSASNLVVFFTSQRFLSEYNSYLKEIICRLKDYKIPILPVFHENMSIELYSETFGTIQYLSMAETDNTSLPFETKLKSALCRILVPDQLEKQIQDAFVAYVFISYRKKNRKEAQMLMELIHQNVQCRDIAFWYDEFLVGGESFPEALQKAIEDSNLLLLSVTPDTLAEGNYILQEELPFANKIKKQMLAAESFPTSAERFYSEIGAKYGLQKHSLSDIVELLKSTLLTSAYEIDESPLHLYFIGLAYLNGIFVEKNIPRGIDLIQNAANSNLPEAIRKLADIYSSGQGVTVDYPNALDWLNRLLLLFERKYDEESDHSYRNTTYDDLISAYIFAGELAGLSGNVDLAERYYSRIKTILNEVSVNSKEEPLYNLFEMKLWYELANTYYGLACSELKRDKSKASTLYHIALNYYEKSGWNNSSFCAAKCNLMIGNIYEDLNDYENAEKYTLSAYNRIHPIISKRYIELFYYALTIFQLSRIEARCDNNLNEIIQRCQTAEALLKQIYSETDDPYYLNPWFDVVLFLAMRYLENEEEESAYTEFLKLLDIATYMDEHYDYVHSNGTDNEERLRETQSIAYYYCAILSGIQDNEAAAYEFLVEAQFALWRLNEISPGKYNDRLKDVEDLLNRLESH